MADIELVIKIPEEIRLALINDIQLSMEQQFIYNSYIKQAIINGTPLTPTVLADELMEERIRGKLNSDTTFEKDIIRDVKCILTVSIRDHRPCYCGAELREVWRENEVKE